MDSLKVLLGVTFALLLVALGFAYTRGGVHGDPLVLARIDELETKCEELKERNIRLEAKLEVLLGAGRQLLPSVTVSRAMETPSSQDQASSQEDADGDEVLGSEEPRGANADLERKRRMLEEQARRDIEAEKALIERQKLEENRPELREKRILRNSDAVAVLDSWNADYALAGLKLIGDPGLKVDDVLVVRRNKMPLGQVKVTEIAIDGVVAKLHPEPRPGMKLPDFKAGDELIFPPK